MSKLSKCWDCKNCSFCSWSHGKPVKGWTAKKTKLKSSRGKVTTSYIVESCPEFEERIYAILTKTYKQLVQEYANEHNLGLRTAYRKYKIFKENEQNDKTN